MQLLQRLMGQALARLEACMAEHECVLKDPSIHRQLPQRLPDPAVVGHPRLTKPSRLTCCDQRSQLWRHRLHGRSGSSNLQLLQERLLQPPPPRGLPAEGLSGPRRHPLPDQPPSLQVTGCSAFAACHALPEVGTNSTCA